VTRQDEIALWGASLQDEVDSAHVYRALTDDSPGGALYARLAEAEERHAAICAERLRALDARADDVAPSRRARILASLRVAARASSPRSGVASGRACLGAIVPIVPYFFVGGSTAVVISAFSSALALFGIGAAITLVTATSWIRSGLRQVGCGIVAPALTYGVGRLLGIAIG